MLIKTREYKQNNNDIYFIQTILDKVIINDNYDGILILDDNLDLIKRLKIFEGMTIYSSFINNVSEEILLFCPDNECMVYINLLTYEYKVIYLKNKFEKLIFSNLYEWNMNGLVLSTYNGELYSISIKEKKIRSIDYEEAERDYTQLYKLLQESKEHKIYRIFPNEDMVLLYDEDSNIKVYNYEGQTKHVLNNVSISSLDIDFREGIFAVVNENVLEIIANNNKVMIYPDENYIFLRGRLLSKHNNIYLIIVSSSKSDAGYSKVDMFRL
ncbi:hypothetical protein [Pectinatus frisingensis]|uniref:hypothetical protein n=1 Tax=Pectinatus frisingensis TaxID=865 RepID=UPI003D801652